MRAKFKTIITSLLAGAMILPSAVCGMSATADSLSDESEETYIYGDVNMDGRVTAIDSLLLLRYTIDSAKLDNIQKISADVNLDGKITSADSLEILRYTINIKTNGKTGQEFTLDSAVADTSHTHVWGDTYQVQVGTQTIDVETDTDVPNEGYTVKETYEIVYEKCKDCGEEIIYKIFKNGKFVWTVPNHSEYSVTFTKEGEAQDWLWEHADLHNIGTYRKEERTEYVTIDVTYPGEGTHIEKITVQQQVPVYETWHDCTECGTSQRVN